MAGLLGGHDRRATPETRTLATYRSTIKHQLIPHVGRRSWEAHPTDVRRMVNHVADAHTTRTAQAAYSVLAKALGMQ
ncbi:hypothetical protein [Gordonia westfalica]|uniref:hypothetical protein n=1 Tax=Gordonia westfalica TaxID=158898 RepID=UPI000AD88717|nr:hypothetical protein [Gordonia westfalica]